MMTPEEHWLRQRETALAWLRVGFSLIAAVVLQFNPERGAKFPILSNVALYGFIAYAFAILYVLTKGKNLKAVGIVSTALDLICVTLIVFSTRGSNSPFFVYYLFPVITASTRYGLKGSLPVALIGVALYGFMRFSPIFERPIAIDTFTVRSIYMLTLAFIFGLLNDVERRQNQKLLLLYNTAAEAAAQEERRRIARELHDRVLQVLASLRLRAEACRRHLIARPAELEHELESIESAAKTTITEIRCFLAAKDSSYDLMAGALKQRLKDELGFLRHSMGVKVSMETNLDGRGLPQGVEQEIYYVLREGILNVARHSLASEVFLSVSHNGTAFNANLRDNGIGFNSHATENGSGYGLRSMRERVEKLGGRLTIQTTPGKGTEISIFMPVPADKSPDESQ